MSLDQGIESLTHHHVFLGSAHDENARRTLGVVILSGAMMVAEIAAGMLFNSMALLADGFHMATHVGALGVAAGAYAYAKRHATSGKYSFGSGKVGDLAGFASALILGAVAVGIGIESVGRLIDPRPVAFAEATWIAVLGLFVNIASAFLLGGHHHGHGHRQSRHHGQNHPKEHHGHEHDSHDHHAEDGHHVQHRDNNLRSAYVHVIADALTSVLAIAALVGGRFLGWVWLDAVMGIVGCIVIAVWAWSLIKDTSAVLLDGADPELEAEVREHVEGPGDARIGDLHVWRVGPAAHAAIVSVNGISRDVAVARLAPIHELAHVTVEIR